MTLSADSTRQAAWSLHAVGILLGLAPLTDLAAGLGSLNPGAVPWRFGALGLLSGALVLPVAGLGLVFLAAVLLEQRALIRLLTAVAGLGLVVVLAGVVLFLLDALQVRAQVRQDAKRAFDLATIKALLTFGIEAIVLLTLALTTWRAARGMEKNRATRRADAGTLVVSKADR